MYIHARAQWDEVRHPRDGDPLKSFSCGLPEVDNVIHRQGFGAWKKERSTPYLCLDSTAGDIKGVFVLKTIGVNVFDIDIDSEQPRTPTANSLADSLTNETGLYSGILLCQLGLSNNVDHHEGQGALLLWQAIDVAVTVHLQSAIDLFVVDAATPELINFYVKATGGYLLPISERRLVAPMPAIHQYLLKPPSSCA